jgi:N-acetylneuraminic acid mutarotase
MKKIQSKIRLSQAMLIFVLLSYAPLSLAFYKNAPSTPESSIPFPSIKPSAISKEDGTLTKLANVLAKPETIISIGKLKNPTAGNAVALVETADTWQVYSFNGIEVDAQGQARMSDQAWHANLSKSIAQTNLPQVLDNLTWTSLPSVPTIQKRTGRYVTASAVIEHNIFLLGGYSANKVKPVTRHSDTQNVSDFYQFDTKLKSYTKLADMPVAVDDTMLLPYQNRFLYVVSGWHKNSAVSLVQVFDTYRNQWFQATSLPSGGMSGHSGGIVENQLIVCDGLATSLQFAAPPKSSVKQQCLLGEIDLLDPSKITWSEWAHPSENGHYRMLSTSDHENGHVWFVGGSTDVFSITGKNAANNLAPPSDEIWRYNFNDKTWKLFETSNPIMDSSGLVFVNGHLISIGGRTKDGITAKALIHR